MNCTSPATNEKNALVFPLLSQLLLGVHDIKGAVDETRNISTVLRKHFVPPR